MMQQQHRIFNRELVKRHRKRATKTIAGHEFLIEDVVSLLASRFEDFSRTFSNILGIGAYGDLLERSLKDHLKGFDSMVMMDSVEDQLTDQGCSINVVADEEWIPFKEESFDLVTVLMQLHWVNDLPGCLIQLRKTLKKDGLFLASFLGGRTLMELRHVLLQVEESYFGAVRPRISPFVDVKDGGMLMQRAGFQLPVADQEVITVMYQDVLSLMKDIKYIGESNALISSSSSQGYGFSRGLLEQIQATYCELYGNSNGEIPATFEVISLTGLK